LVRPLLRKTAAKTRIITTTTIAAAMRRLLEPPAADVVDDVVPLGVVVDKEDGGEDAVVETYELFVGPVEVLVLTDALTDDLLEGEVATEVEEPLVGVRVAQAVLFQSIFTYRM
jgi:hypothetical protein